MCLCICLALRIYILVLEKKHVIHLWPWKGKILLLKFRGKVVYIPMSVLWISELKVLSQKTAFHDHQWYILSAKLCNAVNTQIQRKDYLLIGLWDVHNLRSRNLTSKRSIFSQEDLLHKSIKAWLIAFGENGIHLESKMDESLMD